MFRREFITASCYLEARDQAPWAEMIWKVPATDVRGVGFWCFDNVGDFEEWLKQRRYDRIRATQARSF
jgi:hypothetical protein